MHTYPHTTHTSHIGTLSTAASSAAVDLQRSTSVVSVPPPTDPPSHAEQPPGPRSVLDDLSGFRLMLETALRDDGTQGGGVTMAVPTAGGLFDDDEDEEEEVVCEEKHGEP